MKTLDLDYAKTTDNLLSYIDSTKEGTLNGLQKVRRTSAQRKAMLRDLATDLIINERIETTETRAKELRSVVEK